MDLMTFTSVGLDGPDITTEQFNLMTSKIVGGVSLLVFGDNSH